MTGRTAPASGAVGAAAARGRIGGAVGGACSGGGVKCGPLPLPASAAAIAAIASKSTEASGRNSSAISNQTPLNQSFENIEQKSDYPGRERDTHGYELRDDRRANTGSSQCLAELRPPLPQTIEVLSHA